MDALTENDLRLQRVSKGLLAEFRASLPRYLWVSHVHGGLQHPQKDNVCRRFVKLSKTTNLLKLLEPFQEWPQLIDPHLNQFVQTLVSAFLDYLSNHRESYHLLIAGKSDIIPLPRGICRILYTLCKIRGEKVISQLLNNEAKYLDSMVLAFRDWNGTQGATAHDPPDTSHNPMIWEEKYVMLVWLSHLLLTPFDLESVSSLEAKDVGNGPCRYPISPHPPPVVRIIADCGEHLSYAGREREAARLMLVRLALRPDMREFHLLESFIKWSLSYFQASNQPPRSIYTYLGILSFLNGVLASHEISAVSPYIISVFEVIQGIVAQDSITSQVIFLSAVGRKLLVKLFRSIALQTVKNDYLTLLSSRPNHFEDILAVTIDQLLNFLADKDTPVRCAASKALSVITIALEPSSAADIIEAIISGLNENVLWEDVNSGQVISHDDPRSYKPGLLKQNLTAVSTLRWHGLVLTLSYLIYRRSPPAEQLPSVFNSLILALGFEQRSSSGSFIGTSVRDAACFGIWALARRYTTEELLAVDISSLYIAKEQASPTSIPQILSCELVAAAALDPSGNIRRGASAALQELIGRHPNTIIQGIPLVQTVDYQAVSLRSRATLEVAVDSARFDQLYEKSIISGLLGWRGVGSPDAPSRRCAASAIGLIAASGSQEKMEMIAAKVCHELRSVRGRQVEVRHGLLYSLAMIIRKAGALPEVFHCSNSPTKLNVTGYWSIFRSVCPLRHEDFKTSTSRSEITADAACALISALSMAVNSIKSSPGYQSHLPSPKDLDSYIDILNWSLVFTGENIVKISSSTANHLFSILDESRRESLMQSWATPMRRVSRSSESSSGLLVGYLAALGAVAHHASAAVMMHSVLKIVLYQVSARTLMDSRIAAAKSLSTVLLSCKIMTTSIIEALQICLDNYTNDQRGDIGSHLRIEAIEAVDIAVRYGLLPEEESRQALIARICRLAGERLDKVRIRAWRCMQSHWATFVGPERGCVQINDTNLMSTPEYYEQLLALRSIDWLRGYILEGCINSAGVGSETLIRSSRVALAAHVDTSSASELTKIFADLLTIMNKHVTDDRVIVPALAVLAFLLESASSDGRLHNSFSWRPFFDAVKRCHYRSSNIPKLTLAVRFYSGLAQHAGIDREAMDKLCQMLLHPFPIVRNAAADGLFLVKSLDDFRKVNWANAPKDLRGVVQAIRRQLGVDR